MNSQSILLNLLDNIENKLKITNTTENRPSTKILSDLNFFQEISQKKHNSKLIEDSTRPINSDTLPNKKFEHRSLISTIVKTQTNTNQFETRQLIEREMEPYLFSAKNELRLLMDNFTRDLGDYKFIKNDLNLVKEAVVENKKLILCFQQDIETKFSDNSQKFYFLNKQFDDVKNNFLEITNKFKNYEKTFTNFEEKIQYAECIKDKFESIDVNFRNLSKKMEDDINSKNNFIMKKFKNLENILENFKNENLININEDIQNVKDNFLILSNNLDELNKTTQKYFHNENQLTQLKEKINSNYQNLTNLSSKFDNLDSRSNRIYEYFQNFENLNSRELKKISEKFVEMNKLQIQFQDKLDTITETQNLIKNGFTKISSLDAKISEIEDEIIKNKQNQEIFIKESLNEKFIKSNEYIEKTKDEIIEMYSKVFKTVCLISKSQNEYKIQLDSVIKESQTIDDRQKQIETAIERAIEKERTLSRIDREKEIEKLKTRVGDELKKELNQDIFIEETCAKKLLKANEYTDKAVVDLTDSHSKLNNSVALISKILNEYKIQLDSVIQEKETTNANETLARIEKEKDFERILAEINEKISSYENNRNVNEDQPKINQILQNSLEKLIKQTITITSDINSLKTDNQRFEDNFLSVEKNFDKLNVITNNIVNNQNNTEKKLNLMNEIIKTISINSDKDKKNIQLQFDSVTNIQKESIENTIRIFNGLKNEQDKKLNEMHKNISERIIALDDKFSLNEEKSQNIFTNNPQNNLSQNSLTEISSALTQKFKELTEENEIHRQKIEKAVSKLISTTVERESSQMNQRVFECDEKISKIISYFKSKIEDIDEYINYLNSKYDINYPPNSEVSNRNKLQGNPNNVTKSYNIEEYSNNHPKEILFNIMLWPSFVANNFLNDKFRVKIPNEKHFSEKFLMAEGKDDIKFELKSKKNSIDEFYERNSENSKEKWMMNKKYLTCDPMNFQEIKNEMKGYLNKYIIIPQNYENILEFDGEDNYKEIQLNSPREDNRNYFINKSIEAFLSFGAEKTKNEEDLVCFEGNENEFFDDDDLQNYSDCFK